MGHLCFFVANCFLFASTPQGQSITSKQYRSSLLYFKRTSKDLVGIPALCRWIFLLPQPEKKRENKSSVTNDLHSLSSSRRWLQRTLTQRDCRPHEGQLRTVCALLRSKSHGKQHEVSDPEADFPGDGRCRRGCRVASAVVQSAFKSSLKFKYLDCASAAKLQWQEKGVEGRRTQKVQQWKAAGGTGSGAVELTKWIENCPVACFFFKYFFFLFLSAAVFTLHPCWDNRSAGSSW